MSFGWSIGDLIQGATIAWNIYESVADGPKSAKSDFAAFKEEFSVVKGLLAQLEDAHGKETASGAHLGSGYTTLVKDCTRFIDKHKRLAQQSESVTASARVRILFQQVTWPLERAEAQKLREDLSRYVNIAVMKNTEQARLDNLEMLRTLKTMSNQVSILLRLCLPDMNDMNDNNALNMHFLEQLKQRLLLHDSFPAIEEDVLWSPHGRLESPAALDRIQGTSLKLDHLLMRRNTSLSVSSPSHRQFSPIRRGTVETIDTDATIEPLVGFLNKIGGDVKEALGQAGLDSDAVPGQRAFQTLHHNEETQSLSNVMQDWENFSSWLEFQQMHFPTTKPPRTEAEPPPGKKAAKTARSPPPVIPPSPDPVIEPRQRSYGTPVATNHPIEVVFPHPVSPDKHLHRAIACNITIFFNSYTHEAEFLEATEVGGQAKVTHLMYDQQPGKSAQTSLIPYIPSRQVKGGTASRPYRLYFQGGHRYKINKSGKIERGYISPVYVCHDQEDFMTFQSILLGCKITFDADVCRIETDGGDTHCDLETVRILEDPVASRRSIVYFASHRGGRMLPGFMDWQVAEFDDPKRSKKSLKLPLRQGSLSRRYSVESTMTTSSHDSRTSKSGKSGRSDPMRFKALHFVFHNEKDQTARDLKRH
ncbi:hypothetical protein ASPZODRAFT_139444 [Penicilliopsis zonata CBS 506.65]|uniref:Fungal N-terminal domain-containing protein n=1 Tax=Penicilliopsis zonata CBS 506.65 TaxID=1073090 RepID=A0A1L9SSQ1_9EURO|nr:hypothetical protein ASPZODRAFT_139444 [Penicilliopsis zonata CBS 506.65]OJJ50121.1 hypothetical protein ASPZODRAFT_139444 [Penicilliopsis zonata CBS 506.65]